MENLMLIPPKHKQKMDNKKSITIPSSIAKKEDKDISSPNNNRWPINLSLFGQTQWNRGHFKSPSNPATFPSPRSAWPVLKSICTENKRPLELGERRGQKLRNSLAKEVRQDRCFRGILWRSDMTDRAE